MRQSNSRMTSCSIAVRIIFLGFPLGHAGDWSKAGQATLRGQGCSGAWRATSILGVRDEQLWLVKVLDNPCGDNHRPIPLNLIIPNAGSTPLPATWISVNCSSATTASSRPASAAELHAILMLTWRGPDHQAPVSGSKVVGSVTTDVMVLRLSRIKVMTRIPDGWCCCYPTDASTPSSSHPDCQR